MTNIIHRSLRATPPIAVGGEGVYLIDAAGKRYLDASGGAAVSCLGHGHRDVIAAMHRQIDQLAYAHTGFFTSEPAEQLADHLAANAPAGLTNVYFVSGGSEAMRRRSNSRASISSRSAKPSAPSSSAGARATTATRWARWRSAATSGGASSSRRC